MINTDNLRSLLDRGQVYNPDGLILDLLDEIDALRAGREKGTNDDRHSTP